MMNLRVEHEPCLHLLLATTFVLIILESLGGLRERLVVGFLDCDRCLNSVADLKLFSMGLSLQVSCLELVLQIVGVGIVHTRVIVLLISVA